jgi:predicted HicB family RNase H-like nuclease
MESMYEDGNEIPLPSNQTQYSGKFNVRVPASLHRELARLAVKEGVSLNQYVVYALSRTAGVAETKRSYKEK